MDFVCGKDLSVRLCRFSPSRATTSKGWKHIPYFPISREGKCCSSTGGRARKCWCVPSPWPQICHCSAWDVLTCHCKEIKSAGWKRCQWITPSPQSLLCGTGLGLGFIISTERTVVSLPMIHPTLDSHSYTYLRRKLAGRAPARSWGEWKGFMLQPVWGLITLPLFTHAFRDPKLNGPFKSVEPSDCGEMF